MAQSPISSAQTQILLCPEDHRPEGSITFSKVTEPDGQIRYLIGLPASEPLPPLCQLVETVPVATTHIVAANMFSGSTIPPSSSTILLEGDRDKRGVFVPNCVEPAEEISPQQSTDLEIESFDEAGGNCIKRSARRTGNVPPRSGWVWQPSFWQATPVDSELEKLSAWGIKSVYIFIPMEEHRVIIEAEKLSQFISNASRKGIRVYAVDGDPTAIMPKYHEIYVRRTQTYVEYNNSISEDARLAGIQYDIEPYSLPGFWLNPEIYYANHVQLLQKLKASATDLKIEAAVPTSYLMNPHAKGLTFLNEIRGLIDTLVVMDYRTDQGKIIAQAKPFLAWGKSSQVPIKVALEVGELDNTELQLFTRAQQGTFWMIERPQSNTYLGLLFDEDTRNVTGKTYRYVRQLSVPSSKSTFYGQKDQLRAMLPNLESKLAKSTSFDGIALHDILRDQF